MKQNPFNHSHFIGYINQVSPQFVKIHFPSSILMKSFSFYGEDLKGGLVGSYVVIEGEKYGFLGKILELSLPEKERLELSEKSFNTKDSSLHFITHRMTESFKNKHSIKMQLK